MENERRGIARQILTDLLACVHEIVAADIGMMVLLAKETDGSLIILRTKTVADKAEAERSGNDIADLLLEALREEGKADYTEHKAVFRNRRTGTDEILKDEKKEKRDG